MADVILELKISRGAASRTFAHTVPDAKAQAFLDSIWENTATEEEEEENTPGSNPALDAEIIDRWFWQRIVQWYDRHVGRIARREAGSLEP